MVSLLKRKGFYTPVSSRTQELFHVWPSPPPNPVRLTSCVPAAVGKVTVITSDMASESTNPLWTSNNTSCGRCVAFQGRVQRREEKESLLWCRGTSLCASISITCCAHIAAHYHTTFSSQFTGSLYTELQLVCEARRSEMVSLLRFISEHDAVSEVCPREHNDRCSAASEERGVKG